MLNKTIEGTTETEMENNETTDPAEKKTGEYPPLIDKGLAITLIAQTESECRRFQEILGDTPYGIHETIVARDGAFGSVKGDADLYIISLPKGFHPMEETGDYTLSSTRKPILYLTSETSDKIRLWAFRHGGRDLLVHPFNTAELRFRIERAVAGDTARFERLITPPTMLRFLRDLLGRDVREMEPALEPSVPWGHFYPEVARLFGRTPADVLLLERLAAEGILSRRVANRVRLCPVCSEMGLNYREICPKCGSLDIASTDVVHHFACGHIAPLDAFRKGASLKCPKCNQILRHIGLDYEKPTLHMSCSDCDHIFNDPRVDAQCLWCGFICNPEKTLSRTVYTYTVTPLAQQAVNEERIDGLNLSSLLRSSQTGLYGRPFFEHEAKREIYRVQRSGNPFSLMLIRVEDFEHITTAHAHRSAEFVNTIFTSIDNDLRLLDITCVWDTDLLAVLMPETNSEGALTVSGRIQKNVRGLEYLYAIHEPRVSVGLVTWEERYTTIEEMLADASEQL